VGRGRRQARAGQRGEGDDGGLERVQCHVARSARDVHRPQSATCGPTTATGRRTASRLCDPVEAPTYEVNGVSVSNFVTPAWFDPMSDHATAHYDKLGKLHAPFSILKGGYVVYESAGAEHQQFGDEFPAWRKKMKSGKLARTRRRLNQAEALLAQVTA